MKNFRGKILFTAGFLLLNTLMIYAQEFVVEKINGKAEILRGFSDDFESLTAGSTVSGADLLITFENSSVIIRRGEQRFLLSSNSALGLGNIKKISINDLLLALAMEEIRNVPKIKNNVQSTAVYGSGTKLKSAGLTYSNLGIKKLNGAKLLANNGYKESAIIVAKETYRQYPETKMLVDERLYFAGLLEGLGLLQEALNEYEEIKKLNASNDKSAALDNFIENVSLKIINQ